MWHNLTPITGNILEVMATMENMMTKLIEDGIMLSDKEREDYNNSVVFLRSLYKGLHGDN